MKKFKPYIAVGCSLLVLALFGFWLNSVDSKKLSQPTTNLFSEKSERPALDSNKQVLPNKFRVGQPVSASDIGPTFDVTTLKELGPRASLRVVSSTPTHVSVGLTVDGETAEMAELRFQLNEQGSLIWVDGKIEPFKNSFDSEFPNVEASDFVTLAQKHLATLGVNGQATLGKKFWAMRPNGRAVPAVSVAVEKTIDGRGHKFETWVFNARTKELIRSSSSHRR